MTKKLFSFFLLFILAAGIFPFINSGPEGRAQAAISQWQKGGTILPRWAEDFESDSFRQSVRDLAAANANYVTLVVPVYQSNIHSTDVAAGWNTPPDDTLVSGIAYAHSLGLKVMLKPHLESYDQQWRANINPSDRQGWFNAYGTFIAHLAQLAQQHGVEAFCLGSELISMSTPQVNSTNTSHWLTLIANVRSLYSGHVTYSANWGPSGFVDEKNRIEFWPQLDSIGLAAYFNHSSDSNSVETLKGSWAWWDANHIRPLQQRYNKPIIFTEVGYKSVTGSHKEPWNYNWGGPVDQTEQANSYAAMFSYWNDQPGMMGVHLWEWNSDPNAGGANDPNYTPQNKQAEETMRQWFGGSGGGTTPPPPPPSTGAFNVNAQVSPNPVPANQQGSFTGTVRSAAAANNTLIDFEIYNSSNQKVFQRFFQGENFTAGQSKNYPFAWTPSAAGSYVLKAGVFSSDWSTLHFWSDNVLNFTVTSGGGTTPPPPPPPPPPSSSTVSIWWPTNGATVSGVQPFKAVLDGRNLSEYTMQWQVDGDRLNDMFNSNQDAPHKEALVDVSGWNWKGSGPYVLNFIAKALGGAILGQRSITINVSQ